MNIQRCFLSLSAMLMVLSPFGCLNPGGDSSDDSIAAGQKLQKPPILFPLTCAMCRQALFSWVTLYRQRPRWLLKPKASG